MPKAKYDDIYRDLKERIEQEEYAYQSLLPSENELAARYDCSRNTVRRAIAQLASDGYVQSMHGRGVRTIYQPVEQAAFTVGGIESFKESVARNHRMASTEVLEFRHVIADAKLAARTGFEEGAPLTYILRLRLLDGEPLILDHNYFRSDIAKGLTEDIARASVYDYLEGELGIVITTSKRTMTVEKVTAQDRRYLDLKGYNCLAVITGQTYDDHGVQFEWTQSRHRPDYFRFQDVATRTRPGV
ncbi:trehalose operon repressor [Bifidobacterium callitrichos]|nr:trehalose operon repressor [Bifidobacterium callitrichos]